MTSRRRPGSLDEPRASLSLMDYRRRIADLYAQVRRLRPADGHRVWREGRDSLFATHVQSPIPHDEREAFERLPVWEYDPAWRFEAEVLPPPDGDVRIELPHSGTGVTRCHPAGIVEVELPGGDASLTIFRLDQYGDHLFLPFVDATAGADTYGGGRYLIDTAKGADLGSTERTIVIDFNFAYHPSCVHDARWSCPLASTANRISAPIRAGEHL